MRSATRLSATAFFASKANADAPATTMAVVRNAASTMCATREGVDGLKITCQKSVATIVPSAANSNPCGVCIQELAARIQNDEISVPMATMHVAKKCSFGPTFFHPNSITPRNDASRKNAVSTSYASSGPITLPTCVENTLQLVPNW